MILRDLIYQSITVITLINYKCKSSRVPSECIPTVYLCMYVCYFHKAEMAQKIWVKFGLADTYTELQHKQFFDHYKI